MTRRLLRLLVTLALGFLIAPLAAEAEPAGRVYRLGILERVPLSLNAANFEALRLGLRELGYAEGQNLTIEYRSVEGRPDQFRDLATELINLPVDVLVTRGTPAALAAKQATGTIPIVMAASGDPIGGGIVASLARPGGNVTGLSAVVADAMGKRLELLREVAPAVSHIAAILNMGNPAVAPEWHELAATPRPPGLHLQLLDVRTRADVERAFAVAVQQQVGALIVGIDDLTQGHRRVIVELAATHRLPAMYASREFVEAGGLMTYGVNYPYLYRRAATYVDKILKGAKPADLPIEQPMTLELVINLNTAQALGLTVPPTLLFQADEVLR